MNRPDLLKKSLSFSALPLLLILMTFSVYYLREIGEEQRVIAAREHLNLRVIQLELSEALHSMADDLKLLSSHYELEAFLSGRNAPFEALKREFAAFLELKEIFSEIRLLDTEGNAVIQSHYAGGRTGLPPGKAAERQTDPHRFEKIQTLGRDELYFFPLEPRLKGGPLSEADFQIALPLFKDGQQKGALLLSVPITVLLRYPEKHLMEGGTHSLFVGTGPFYFRHEAKESGWELLRTDVDKPFAKHPEDWTRIQEQASGQSLNDRGLLSFTSISPEQALHRGKHASRHKVQIPGSTLFPLRFVSVVPMDVFAKKSDQILERLFWIFLPFLLVLGFGAFSLARVSLRRRFSEEKLFKSEVRYRQLVEETGYGVEELDASGRIVFANEAYHRMLGYAPGALVGQRLMELLPPEFRDWAASCLRPKPEGMQTPKLEEAQMIRRDGRIIDIEAARHTRQGPEGAVLGFTSIITEISRRKAAEKRIETALLEKEVLLREVHHRVKNNLQIIRSLLYLQGKSIQGEENRRRFQEAQERIQTMALVHEQLYRSENITRVHFGPYIENLVNALKKSYDMDEGRVRIFLELEDLPLSIDLAIPCGLIVNELVSNMMKHAFPDKRSGEIRIACHSEKSGRIALSIGDNGVGFSEGLDLDNSQSLGLHLVSLLVGQLGGKITLDRSGGTCYHILFKGDL